MEEEFIEKLREIVERSSQKRVAEAAGLSQSTVCRLLGGSRVGNLKTAMGLMEAYPELMEIFLRHGGPGHGNQDANGNL